LRVLDTRHGRVGADARRVFSKYGIRFGSNGAEVTLAPGPPTSGIGTPRPEPPYIRNRPPEGSQDDIPLVIDSRFPVRTLALVFNGGRKTSATVTGFNAEGSLLGKLEYDDLGWTVATIEALAPEGITKLVVKFEGDQKDEEIKGELAVEFVDPLLFTTVVPQIGDGLLGQDESVLSNR